MIQKLFSSQKMENTGAAINQTSGESQGSHRLMTTFIYRKPIIYNSRCSRCFLDFKKGDNLVTSIIENYPVGILTHESCIMASDNVIGKFYVSKDPDVTALPFISEGEELDWGAILIMRGERTRRWFVLLDPSTMLAPCIYTGKDLHNLAEHLGGDMRIGRKDDSEQVDYFQAHKIGTRVGSSADIAFLDQRI